MTLLDYLIKESLNIRFSTLIRLVSCDLDESYVDLWRSVSVNLHKKKIVHGINVI